MKQCLKDDENEHTKKQNHTAKRIYTRLVEEMGFTGGETTVRAYVHALKGKAAEVFVPLYFAPGDAIQIDWGEATVSLAGDKLVVNLFCARLCYSDMPFVIAYRRQNSESFLDALVQAFEFFGGTPKRVIFDNAKVTVKDGFGANARATDGYAALSAHYGFEPIFCNIASGNEKGLVEGLVGFSRRNFCVPIATWQKKRRFPPPFAATPPLQSPAWRSAVWLDTRGCPRTARNSRPVLRRSWTTTSPTLQAARIGNSRVCTAMKVCRQQAQRTERASYRWCRTLWMGSSVLSSQNLCLDLREIRSIPSRPSEN